jgi:hypothetical protein
MKKIIGLFVFLFITGSILFSQEFSADVVSKTNGQTVNSKMFVSNGNSRMEMSMPGSDDKSIMIARPDKKIAWMLLPGNMYMELPLKPENTVASKDKMPGEVERTLVGKENINGTETGKYKITTLNDEKKVIFFAWLDKEGLPVKMTDENGKLSMEYKNIKKGKQPDNLFELPEGYKKFEMPKM